MLTITDQEFEALINQSMDELPQEYIQRLNNVAIVYEDEPTAEQRRKLKLLCHETLFGLYEGIPLTKRDSGYNLVLPDKITLFKQSMLASSPDLASLKAQVKHTLWHEIAHFYGLDHERIHKIEQNWR